MKRLFPLLFLVVAVLFVSSAAMAQLNPTGTLVGSVMDPQGAAVVGAKVALLDPATNAKIETSSDAEGKFQVANLPPGDYTVTVTTAGFKTAVFNKVTIIVNQSYDLQAKLEVGEVSTTVTVEAGQQVLETQNTAVGYTISGTSITHLPFSSTNALDLAILDPGAQTSGRPRDSAFEGLPKGTMNITFDGINVQDNLLKSNDGFFANIRPRIDDVEEFGITEAGNSADKAGEGAVQMNFVSKRGGNDFHGSLWEYNRNTDFDSNYYFNNLASQPRQVLQFNEFGGSVGGRILRDKLWFFVDADFYLFPLSVLRQPTVLNTNAANGLFTYAPTVANNCGASTFVTQVGANCQVNLYALASANGFPSTPDGSTHPLIAATQSAVTTSGVTTTPSPLSLNLLQLNFLNKATDNRKYPDARLDYQISQHNHLELDWHYSHYNTTPDILNSTDPTLPVAPFSGDAGNQISNRTLGVIAWTANIGTSMSNEVRAGIQDAPTVFGVGEQTSLYPGVTTNVGTIHVRPAMPSINGFTPTNPLLSFSTQGRNTVVGQVLDNFSWTKGNHNIGFGADVTLIRLNDYFDSTSIGSVGFGISQGDTAANMFSAANVPNLSASDLTSAENLYSLLTGRVNSYSSTVEYAPSVGNYQTGAPEVDKQGQNEFGVYVRDSWRIRPTLTLNYGLRWEFQGVPYDAYNEYYMLQNGYTGAFGISGQGNLFAPGTLTGTHPTFINDKGQQWYKNYYKNFAPNMGVAWQPSSDMPFLKSFLGGAGKTVIRASYAISYSREGLETWEEVSEDNPGPFANQSSSPSTTASTTNGTFPFGSILLNSANFQDVLQVPSTFSPSFALSPAAGQSSFAFAPNLRPPMIQSWTLGWQREITPSSVLEIRYVGNHGTRLYRAYNINEVNIFENGFLGEFRLAANNLNICTKVNPTGCLAAEQALGVATTTLKPDFANLGLSGQQNLPIITAAFTGSTNANGASGAVCNNQCNSNFVASSLVTDLQDGFAGSFASAIDGAGSSSISFWNNIQTAGLPSNFWIVDPDARGGSTVFDNGSGSTYDAMIVDYRMRPSHGLQYDLNYTFSKSLTNAFANSAVDSAAFTTLRNPSYNKGPAAFDIRDALKLQLIYQLPFGTGRKWSSAHAWVNEVIGGWEFNSITRFQTGPPIQLTSGLGNTFNNSDPGIQLNGITASQLQGMLQTIKQNGAVYYLPSALLDLNLQKANTSIIQPCETAGQLCQRLFVWGPSFFRADWSLQKGFTITEHVKIELRAELLNAFNDADFYYACAASTAPCSISTQSTAFGKMAGAYQDYSTTQDPGGRIVQLVGRLNF